MEFPPPRNPNDLGRGPLVMGLTWTFTGLAIITTVLRMFVRRKVGTRKLGPDDWIMFAAMLLQLVNQILISIAFRYGMGKHLADLYIPDQLVTMSMWEWLAVPPGSAAAILARISICIVLVRLFGIYKWFKWFTIILTTLGVTMGAILAICIFAQFEPAEGLWNPFLPSIATRLDTHVLQDLQFFGQALYALADLAFVVIPIGIIWRLNMDLKRRLGLVLLMTAGLFICAMSILKGVSAIPNTNGEDGPYAGTLSLLWATLEQASVVLIGNVAPLRPIFKLDIPVFRTIADSVASLLGRGSQADTRGSGATGKVSGYRNYHDIELGTHKLGKVSDVSHIVNGHSPSANSSAKSLVEGNKVRRTDAFTVVYDGSGRPSGTQV
ncbi:hypothetical protein B0T17DRAFT_236873 [Bombardia bombarda]|uniref:Rhodopsin domain-containing protein n=1 Tax=Bombardia bombarda TaxID=252184 RepID=A0AA39XBQ1_9PEZI|nr:hypothetical protein B0T17DRAFT_236873 [Bombardia bombarda]